MDSRLTAWAAASGMGIEYGLEAVEQYTRVKTIVMMHGGWMSPFA